MRVVLSWLREFCPAPGSPEELSDLLSAKGIHVESIERPWAGLEGVVVAKVVEVRDHPRSETLCLARVSYGSGERELVVGVRNMRPGDLVPLAGPGARLPSLDAPIGAREIRGVVSDGMLCSPRELAISADHGGILILPPDAPVGGDFKTYAGLDDAVIDAEIESNRPDLLCVLGVAREVAAATGTPLRQPDPSLVESEEKAEEVATVRVDDLERCPRYLARVIRGVGSSPSPIRVQARLTAAGMRPLSNVVDATNYAMLELGQPLHAFDLARLHGSRIIVRRAAEGERLVTLDDVERTLSAEDLVIADETTPVAIAGVIGSAAAEVGPGTTDVLLESAYFERRGVIRTSRRLNLQTEASTRFGRGADPENPPRGAALAARLMAEWAGGTVLAGALDVGEAPHRRWLGVRPSRASLVLGYDVSAHDVITAFDRLGIGTRSAAGAVEVGVEVPGYRVDLEREIDLVEEVARVQGYERIRSHRPAIRQSGGVAPSYALRRRARAALVRAGLRETQSVSFGSVEDFALVGLEAAATGVRVRNPLAADQAYLRPRLLPSLLRGLARNFSRGVRGAALFEAGHVFWRTDGQVTEREFVAAAVAGEASAGYPDPSRSFDFFDAKGVLAALLDGLSVRPWDLGGASGWPLHPGRSAVVLAGGEEIGVVGELHPRAGAERDLPPGTAGFEIDLTRLSRHAEQPFRYRDVPRFPPVRRDLAFVLDGDTAAAAVEETIREAGGDLVGTVALFDVFMGDPIAAGKKSLAFSVDFRAPDRTLTDEEAEPAVRAIVDAVADRFGGALRA